MDHACGAVCLDSTMRSAMMRRAWLSGMTVPGIGCEYVDVPEGGGADGACAGAPVAAKFVPTEIACPTAAAGPMRAAVSTSSAVTRPFAPLPASARMSTWCSRASLRTAGEALRSAASRSAPFADACAAAAPLCDAPCAGCASGADALAGSCDAAGAGAGALSVAAPTSSMTAIAVPVATVSPSLTSSSRMVPVTGEGTSALTLSVETSTKASYFSTASPGFLSHCATVPSVTVSPSCGIVIVVAIVLSRPLVLRTAPARAWPAPSRPANSCTLPRAEARSPSPERPARRGGESAHRG